MKPRYPSPHAVVEPHTCYDMGCGCPACRFRRDCEVRREETDSYLESIGAVVIQVEDLGAMETVLFELERGTSALEPDFRERFLLALQEGPDHAAHLARVALGEVES